MRTVSLKPFRDQARAIRRRLEQAMDCGYYSRTVSLAIDKTLVLEELGQ